MKSTSLLKYLLFAFITLSLSCSSDDEQEETTMTNPDVTDQTSLADQILVLINAHRQSEGLEILDKNDTATQLAIDHSNYMITQQNISHDNFDDRAAVLRDQENALGWAENVASGYTTAESVVNGWLESSGHRRNIEGNYTKTGIAAIKSGNGRYYYTQLFFR